MMHLQGEGPLQRAIRRHPDIRGWVDRWVEAVKVAEWQSVSDVRRDYPTADGVKLRSRVVITVFNVRGNTYRLLSHINYKEQTVLALEVLTHAEYDKDEWKERY
jgi:mRNA interferase HigB